MRIGALAVPVTFELAVAELSAVALPVVTARFLALAVSAVAGAGAVPREGKAKTIPEVVDGAAMTPLLIDTEFVSGVLITGTVVPAIGVADVIDAVDAAVVTALDTDVGTAIADIPPPPPLVIAGTGVELTELFTVN